MRDRHFSEYKGQEFHKKLRLLETNWIPTKNVKNTRTWGGSSITSSKKQSVNLTDQCIFSLSWYFVGFIYCKKTQPRKTYGLNKTIHVGAAKLSLLATWRVVTPWKHTAPLHPHLIGGCIGDPHPIGSMELVYLPAISIKINQMQVNIPYMDPMGILLDGITHPQNCQPLSNLTVSVKSNQMIFSFKI